MTRTLSLEKAAETLPSIVEKLRSGDFVVVERNGKPVAGIVDANDMEDFIDTKNKVLKLQIKKGYNEFKKGKTAPARALLMALKRS